MHALHACIPNLLATVRNLTSHCSDTVACALRDTFYRFCDFAGAVGGVEGALFFYVEIFCVFANDDEVDLGF